MNAQNRTSELESEILLSSDKLEQYKGYLVRQRYQIGVCLRCIQPVLPVLWYWILYSFRTAPKVFFLYLKVLLLRSVARISYLPPKK